MIYTSYLANIRKLPSDFVPISIMLYSPKWCGIREFKELAPTKEILNSWKESKQDPSDMIKYQERYNKDVLSKLNAAQVEEELYKMSDGKDVVLCCTEVSSAFCHRILDRIWFKSNGIDCEEFIVKK